MSSAANALLCNIAEGKQCNLLSYFSAHTRPPQRLNRAPKAGLAKSRGRHGSFPHYAHRRPNFTGDRSEARGHGAAHAALPPGWLGAGCACWCAPDGFAARKRRGGTQGAATPEGARRGGPPPAWGSLMGLLRPHRAVAPAPRAPTDARGDHARPPPRILRLFSAVAKCQIRRFYLGLAGAKAAATSAATLVLPSPPPQSTRRGSARNLERAWDGTLADRLTRTSTLAPPRRTVR